MIPCLPVLPFSSLDFLPFFSTSICLLTLLPPVVLLLIAPTDSYNGHRTLFCPLTFFFSCFISSRVLLSPPTLFVLRYFLVYLFLICLGFLRGSTSVLRFCLFSRKQAAVCSPGSSVSIRFVAKGRPRPSGCHFRNDKLLRGMTGYLLFPRSHRSPHFEFAETI